MRIIISTGLKTKVPKHSNLSDMKFVTDLILEDNMFTSGFRTPSLINMLASLKD